MQQRSAAAYALGAFLCASLSVKSLYFGHMEPLALERSPVNLCRSEVKEWNALCPAVPAVQVPGVSLDMYYLTLACSIAGGLVVGFVNKLEPQGKKGLMCH